MEQRAAGDIWDSVGWSEISDKGSSYVKPLARGVRNRVEAKKISLHDIE